MTRVVRRSGAWVVASVLVVALLLALPPTGNAAGTTGDTGALATAASFVIIDEPEDLPDGEGRPPFAVHTPFEVDGIARTNAGVRDALRLRPGSSVHVAWEAHTRRWRAYVRDRESGKTLASVQVDDRTGRVIAAFALPLDAYPTHTTRADAIAHARADPQVRRAAKEWGGVARLVTRATVEHLVWQVDFTAPERTDGGDPAQSVILAEVDDGTGEVRAVWTGFRIPWHMTRGDRYAFGGDVNQPATWIAVLVLFALVGIDWTHLRSRRSMDALALLAMAVSHEAFQRGAIEWSVPLAVPPLLWLAFSMAGRFRHGARIELPRRAPSERSRLVRLALRRVPTILLVVLCVALAGLRIGVTLAGGNVIDVGYAGLAGARSELHGQAPWTHMPVDNPHGDTYGPLNYLAYVPASKLIDDPITDTWGRPLPAAQATSIAADLGCALVLAWIGWRWISRRAGVLLAVLWFACPWTTWALASGVNDSLVALVLLAAFLAVRRPAMRGFLLGAAALVKFAPLAAVAPMLHVGSRPGRLRQATATTLGCAVAVGLGLGWVVYRLEGRAWGNLRTFADRTLGFQIDRGSPFSPWGLYDLMGVQTVVQCLVVLLLVAMCVRPRARDAWQAAAGIALALILIQLVLTHWFYLYIPWFVGFVLLVGVVERERAASARSGAG